MNTLSNFQTSEGIRGIILPAIIKNGSNFLTQIKIYEDGIIDCWGCVDLALFKEKLEQEWVLPTLEEKSSLHISMTAAVTIKNVKNNFDNKHAFFDYVISLIRTLNPNLSNLYDMAGSDRYKVKGASYYTSKVSRRAALRQKMAKQSAVSSFTKSDSMHHFIQRKDMFYFVETVLFDDGTVIIFGLDDPQETTHQFLKEDIDSKAFFAIPKNGETICIQGLLSAKVDEATWFKTLDDFKDEFEDILDTLDNKPSRVAVCCEAFELYKSNPTEETLASLRIAYENVPTHQRPFCGNQDEKDIPIRMAIYGEGEIENWSHWQVAKSEGEDLPQITVPKPKA